MAVTGIERWSVHALVARTYGFPVFLDELDDRARMAYHRTYKCERKSGNARAPGVRNARRRRRRRRRKMIDVGIKSSAPTRTWPMRTNVYPSANNIACEWRINLPGVHIGPTTAGLYADPVEIRECRFRVIVSLQNIPTWYFYSWRREREGRISTNALRSARWSWNCTFGGARKTANPPIDKYLLKNLLKKLQKILLDYYLIILRLKSR